MALRGVRFPTRKLAFLLCPWYLLRPDLWPRLSQIILYIYIHKQHNQLKPKGESQAAPAHSSACLTIHISYPSQESGLVLSTSWHPSSRLRFKIVRPPIHSQSFYESISLLQKFRRINNVDASASQLLQTPSDGSSVFCCNGAAAASVVVLGFYWPISVTAGSPSRGTA